MIKSLQISGFKSFKSATIPMNAVTLLCGLNNSGKSTVLQALRMYCKSAETTDPMLVGHGSYSELRSRFVLPNTPITITCTSFDDRSETLTLDESGFIKVKSSPFVTFLSAERFGPRVTLPIKGEYKSSPTIGENGEYVADYLTAHRDWIVPATLHHEASQGSTLEYEVKGWLSEIAPGAELSFSVDKKSDSSSLTFESYRATNAGFGLSYSLPIISAILGSKASPPKAQQSNEPMRPWEVQRALWGTLLILENPEAHLHPSAQTAIGRLIARGGFSGAQIVVETQSEHIMDGIRLEIRENPESNTRVTFNYISRKNGEESTVETPTISSTGKLSYWPTGFFDQALKNKLQLAR
jgi:predicted ATPase